MLRSLVGSEMCIRDSTQALYLPRAYLLSLGERVECIYWYEFRDGGDDATYNEHRFGVVRNDLDPKPAYRAYATLARALGQAKLVEKREVGEGSYCYVFDAGETLTAAIWRAEGEAQITIDAPGNVATVDYMGQPAHVEMRDGTATVTASEKVLYLTGISKAPE